MAGAPVPRADSGTGDRRAPAAQGSSSLHRYRRAPLRGADSRVAADACRCPSFWLLARRGCGGHGAARLDAAAGVSSLLPAGRVRASPVPEVDERAIAHGSCLLARGWVLRGSPPTRPWLAGLAFVAGRAGARVAAAGSEPIGKDSAAADLARHARAHGGGSIRWAAVAGSHALVYWTGLLASGLYRGRDPGRAPPLLLVAANAVLAPYEQHVQRGYEAEAARARRRPQTRSSSASPEATGRAARSRCSPTSSSSMRRRWRRRAASIRSWASRATSARSWSSATGSWWWRWARSRPDRSGACAS